MAVIRINDLINDGHIMLKWGVCNLGAATRHTFWSTVRHRTIWQLSSRDHPCHNMACHVMLCHSLPRHIVTCHHIMICHGTSCCANSWSDHDDPMPPHITSHGEFPHSSVLTVFYKVVVAAAVSRTSIQEITIINFENQLVFSCLVRLSSLVPVSLTKKINHGGWTQK